MQRRTGVATAISGGILVVLALGLAGPGLTQVRDSSSNVAAATFRSLGDLPGGGFLSEATAVSTDGAVVVGKSASSPSGEEAFRWTPAQGLIGLGIPQDALTSTATDVSADGTVVVGWAYYGGWFGISGAFRWTAGTGMVDLGIVGQAATPPDVSADGAVVVGGGCSSGSFGAGDCNAYRWTQDEGMVGLGDPLLDTIAAGVSADGSIVVGGVEVGPMTECDCIAAGSCGAMHDAFRWIGGDMTTLGLPRRACEGFGAGEVSADGQVLLVGLWRESLSTRWTAGSGMVGLGDLPGGPSRTRAQALSGDGSIVVGSSWSASGQEAFVWDATNRMRSLRALLVDEHGLDLTGWTLISANGVSDDGQTIVGTGVNPDGHTEAWVATLPGVDSDGDGVIDYTDACKNSNVDGMLSIGDCATGIANNVDADGCTLADALATACPPGEGPNAHGAFVSCVAHQAHAWREAGRIDAEDHLMACAGRRPS